MVHYSHILLKHPSNGDYFINIWPILRELTQTMGKK
jgi:hypothetical protein